MSRFYGYFALLVLAAGAFALPLAAQDIIVTVPPDPPDPPEQTEAAPEAQPPTLPSFAGDDASPGPVAQDTTSPVPDVQPEATAPPEASPEPIQPSAAQGNDAAPAPVAVESAPPKSPQAKAKKTVSPVVTNSEEPAAKPAGQAAKPKAKKVSASASCKKLDETACGANTACIWVVGTPAEGTSKGTTAGCRSMAAMKKEAEKSRKAAKTGSPEVLPWAAQTTTATAPSSASGGD